MHPTRLFRTTGFRLSALYAGLFGLSVALLFSVIFWDTREAMYAQVSAKIEAEAAILTAEYRTGGVPQLSAAIETRLRSRLPDGGYYLLTDRDGRKIIGNLPVRTFVAGWRQLPLPRGNAKRRDDDFGEHGVYVLGIELADGSHLSVAESTRRIGETLETIVRAFVLGGVGTIVLGALGGILLSTGFLRRVDAINRISRAIMAGRMTDRIPIRGTDDELDKLSSNLNEMLDRLQALMESLRQVSNDIAHDLRTPLSRLRQRLETTRIHAGSVAEYEDAIDHAIAETDGLLKTFSGLLRIAQIEAGTRRSAFQPLDLSAAILSIAEIFEPVAEDQGKTLRTRAEPGIAVRGDRDLLTQMVVNLIENAIRHTPDGAEISLTLDEGPDGPVVVVADDGPGIPAAERDRVFQRFFRLERSRSTPGSGLGLSLVAAIADLHDIEIVLSDNAPGLTVELRFRP